MDFNANRRRINAPVIDDSLTELYKHNLSMYKEPPQNVITLPEFEEIALERLQLFRIIEAASTQGHKIYSDDWKTYIKKSLSDSGLKKYFRLMSSSSSSNSTDADYQARRVDHISHFILKIAYCRSEDLKRVFLSRELDWFRLRFMEQSAQTVKEFLQLYNLQYTPISDEEKMTLREDLQASTAGTFTFDVTEFYRVPFTEVISLVKNRKVFIKKGFAYVPSFELIVCIQTKLRADWSESLAYCSRRLHLFDDDRIIPILSNIHFAHTGKNYMVREDKDRIDPENIDAYSKKHFPLCMRHMHEMLRSDHHLKHGARLTYGLFLKGIGLLYEDAVRFWRDEFTKKIDQGKFEKEYLYNIKHTYGKVGRMLNYSPYSCIRIIMSTIGPGEHHGCPFKTWDPAYIKQKLVEYGISNERTNEIKELVNNGHYQLACGKYFECCHGKPSLTGINHPNQYFEESVNLEKKNTTK